MNGNAENIRKTADRFYVTFGGGGWIKDDAEEVIRVLEDARERKTRAESENPWRIVRVRRYKGHFGEDAGLTVCELDFEGIYYEAAYRPRVWRC
jgi:hypothetical protein